MDVSSAKVCDEDGFVSRGMTIEAHDVVMKDQFWIIRVISNTVFSPRMRMLARRCTTIVSYFRGVPELRLEHYKVGVSDFMLSFREMCFRI